MQKRFLHPRAFSMPDSIFRAICKGAEQRGIKRSAFVRLLLTYALDRLSLDDFQNKAFKN